MRGLEADPLTWTYVKLLGRQLQENVRDWDGLPNSHAWAVSRSAPPQHLLTKAQCVGILVSIHQRAERVELLVDDGTALVRAVLWKPSLDEKLALGDLVRVEGKLNMDTSWMTDAAKEREIRVIGITKITDPNEELLYWLDVKEMTTQIYSSGGDRLASSSQETTFRTRHKMAASAVASTAWDRIVVNAFHDRIVDDDLVNEFLCRGDKSPHDAILINTLQQLLDQQSKIISAQTGEERPTALRVTFPTLLRDALEQEGIATDQALNHSLTRSLRHAFATLRSCGLLHLENTESDEYVLLSSDIVLTPALAGFLKLNPMGMATVEITERILSQAQFRRLPLESIERTLYTMAASGLTEYQEDSQRWIYRLSTSDA